LGLGDYHWQHECCLYAIRHGAKRRWRSNRKQSTLWEVAKNGGKSAQCFERYDLLDQLAALKWVANY